MSKRKFDISQEFLSHHSAKITKEYYFNSYLDS